MKLLEMKKQHKRSFVMPDDGKSSCCGLMPFTLANSQSCPGCGKELYFLGKHPNQAIIFTDMDAIFVNDNQYGKRVRQVQYMSKYFQSKKHGKIVRINILDSFTYNFATGRLYRVNIKNYTNKQVRDITYKAAGYQLKPDFLKKVVQMRAFQLLPEVDIIRDIEQSMGIKDIFTYIDSMYASDDDVSINKDVDHMLYCLAYPKFTWINCPIHAAPTPRFRKALKEGKNRKELYGAFFHGNVGKSTIQFLNEPLLGYTEFAWSAVRFLSMFMNKDKLWSLINSGWIINLIDTKDYWYDADQDKEFTPWAVRKFTDEYGVNRFINHIGDVAPVMGAQGIMTYIRDSLAMWKNLKAELPEWTLPRCSSLRETHDILTRDSKKIAVDNQDIEYEWEDTDLNTEYGGIEFDLPKDVHTIIDNGDRMKICVGGGGYTNAAVKRDITILFGFINDEPEVCMEIKDGKLVQAKLVQNSPAKDDLGIREAIKELCGKVNIDYSGCYDMMDHHILNPGARVVHAVVEPDNDPFGLNF